MTSLSYYIMLLRKDFIDYCNQQLQKIGLSQGLLFFILYIGKYPGCTQKELTDALHLDTGHVTRSLTRLGQSGFIRQEKNPKDGRSKILCLEEKGQEAFSVSHELFTKWDEHITGNMSDDQRAQLMSLLGHLTTKEEVHLHEICSYIQQ